MWHSAQRFLISCPSSRGVLNSSSIVPTLAIVIYLSIYLSLYRYLDQTLNQTTP